MGLKGRWGLATGAAAAALLLAGPLLAADLGPAPGAWRGNRGAYAGEPRFRSACAEQGHATLLGCLPQTVYDPPLPDAAAWNQLSAFGAQHRPYPTLSPWAN